MKKVIALSAACSAFVAVAAPEVSNVSLTQSGNTVTIGYTLSTAPGIVTVDIQTNVTDDVWASIGAENQTRFVGDVNKRVDTGAHTMTWKPGEDWAYSKKSAEVRAVVTAWAVDAPPDYMVISLTNSNSMAFYTSAEAIPFGGVTNDMYKTDYLVMRKIPAANVRWRMGSLVTDTERDTAGEVPHMVTLGDDFYIGIYEVTQRQYELMLNRRPSLYGNDQVYATRPVERVTYEAIRGETADGNDWPNDGHSVSADSFLGKLRTITGVNDIDLPTEAQWEFACRAGSGSVLYTDSDGAAISLDEIGRYIGNGGKILGEDGKYIDPDANCTLENATAAVGSYKPNAWGVYDMIGNVREWCLDWYQDDNVTGCDPATGPTSGETRAYRGGAFCHSAHDNRCAERGGWTKTSGGDFLGFRLAKSAVIQ